MILDLWMPTLRSRTGWDQGSRYHQAEQPISGSQSQGMPLVIGSHKWSRHHWIRQTSNISGIFGGGYIKALGLAIHMICTTHVNMKHVYAYNINIRLHLGSVQSLCWLMISSWIESYPSYIEVFFHKPIEGSRLFIQTSFIHHQFINHKYG